MTTTPSDLASLAAIRQRIREQDSHIAELQRELEGCESDMQKLVDQAYWQLGRLFAADDSLTVSRCRASTHTATGSPSWRAAAMPGSWGERALQERYGTANRARGFYDHQLLDHLNEHMQTFIARQEMVFIATADAGGETDCSFRAGPPGFVCALDERTLVHPEYRGNGVMTSLGNIAENGHIGLLFVDFGDGIGLHVNGRASIVENDALLDRPQLPDAVLEGLVRDGGRRPERWIGIDVVEAYIHCSKHIPQLVKLSDVRQAGGTDDVARKGGDYFKAKHTPRPRAETAPS